MTPSEPSRPTDPQQSDPPHSRPRTISSSELLAGDKEILIDHEGETYRLRLTRNGKLILHK